jgi:hypothetical protein
MVKHTGWLGGLISLSLIPLVSSVETGDHQTISNNLPPLREGTGQTAANRPQL